MKLFDKTKWAAALLALAVGLAGCGPVEGNNPSSKPQEGSSTASQAPTAEEPEQLVQVEGVGDYSIYPETPDDGLLEPLDLEGNWLEIYRDTDEGVYDTDPEDADTLCFMPMEGGTEGSQIPLTVTMLTPFPQLNVVDAELFYNQGTPEVAFRSNQDWYAVFTAPDGSRYALTLEDPDTVALKIYLEGDMSYLSLVNTVYFARQQAMG